MSERFLVELEPVGGAWSRIPAEIRIRRFLKCALRAWGLRARVISRSTATQGQPSPPIAAPAPADGRLAAHAEEAAR